MPMEVIVRLIVLVAVLVMTGASQAPAQRPRSAALPEHPCDWLTAKQVAAVTGLEVLEARRVPHSDMIVRSERDGEPGREEEPGEVCSYKTRSDVGFIHVILPPPAHRGAADYRAFRETYFRLHPGSAAPVPDLGEDAWLAGGNTLYVLARPGVHFIVATQMWQERSRDVVIALARAVLGRL